MNTNLRWKLITVFVTFVLFFAVGVYPILAARYHWPVPGWLAQRQLRLGLDLKGGVHLVLRVQTDDALKIMTTTTSEQLREQLRTANVPVSAITVTSPTTFRVEGIAGDRDAEFRKIAGDLTSANYDNVAGAGGAYDFKMKPNIERDTREQAVVQAMQTIDRRVNELGVAEPNISRYGVAGDQILVQLPGESDVARAKSIISNTALLELKIVEAGPAPTKEALLQSFNGQVPPDMDVVTGATGSADAPTSFYMVRKVAGITGRDLRNAKPSLDENNRPAVSFSLTTEG